MQYSGGTSVDRLVEPDLTRRSAFRLAGRTTSTEPAGAVFRRLSSRACDAGRVIGLVTKRTDFDVIVVGGGAAGCVVAARLSESPSRRVLLLEAGPDLRADMPPEIRSGWSVAVSFDWDYASEPDRWGAVQPLPRGRLLGGCSSTNATFALRGHPADYDAWAEAGNAGWGFEDVLPYFRRLETDADYGAEPWHGDQGPLPIRRYRESELTPVGMAGLEAFAAAGFAAVDDHNRPGAVGAGRAPVSTRDGVRISTALAYLPTGPDRPNLTIRADAQAADIVFDGRVAVGVRLLDESVVYGSGIVLSAGSYASPGILLRSGIGPADELIGLGLPVRVDLPGVGANLIDHPTVSIDFEYAADAAPQPVFQVVATGRSSGAKPDGSPDLQFLVAGPYAGAPEAPPGFFVSATLLKARSRGRVSMRSPLPTDPPRIELGYFSDPADLAPLLEGLQRAEQIASHAALRGLAVREPDRAWVGDEPAWIGQNAWTYHHPVGTCAMGTSPDAGAVVDSTGRVHGTEGLFVVDASVMPDIPSANTHVPTIMVAERLADGLGRVF